jgi:hypothetical protein
VAWVWEVWEVWVVWAWIWECRIYLCQPMTIAVHIAKRRWKLFKRLAIPRSQNAPTVATRRWSEGLVAASASSFKEQGFTSRTTVRDVKIKTRTIRGPAKTVVAPAANSLLGRFYREGREESRRARRKKKEHYFSLFSSRLFAALRGSSRPSR